MNVSNGSRPGTCGKDGSGHQTKPHDSQGPPESRPYHRAGAGDREHLDPSTHLRHYQFNRTVHNLIRLLGEHLEDPEVREFGLLNQRNRDTLRDRLDEIRTESLVKAIGKRLRRPNQQDCRKGCEASLVDIAALPVNERAVPLRELAGGLSMVPGDLTEMGKQVRELAQGLPADDRWVIENAVTQATTPR